MDLEAKEKILRMWEDCLNVSKGVEVTSTGTKYSIIENLKDTDGNEYGQAVLLDTDYFNGISPRKWNKALVEYIKNRTRNSTAIIPVVDENGNLQMLEFAKNNERIDGKRKVVDELAYNHDNIAKLSVIHIDEIAVVSDENDTYYTEPTKNIWLDKNGWLRRNAYVVNAKNNTIFNVTLDIAKTADGRLIAYSLHGKTKKIGNVDVNSLKIRGSGQNTNPLSNIPQSSENSNTDSEKLSAKEGLIDAERKQHQYVIIQQKMTCIHGYAVLTKKNCAKTQRELKKLNNGLMIRV